MGGKNGITEAPSIGGILLKILLEDPWSGIQQIDEKGGVLGACRTNRAMLQDFHTIFWFLPSPTIGNAH